MKTCKKSVIAIPLETVVAWLREKFPELPGDIVITDVYAAVAFEHAVKFTLEHSFEVSATPVKVPPVPAAADLITLPGEGDA